MDKITVKQIADRLGITRQRLYYILRKRRSWTIEEAIRWEKASEGRYKAKQFIPDIKKRIKAMVDAL